MIKGSEIVLNTLLEEGVEVVFGYPGGAVIPLYDTLMDYEDRLTHVLTAHEQGATHAADGYARSTGKVGVVFATSGPGATNTVTGIANAYMDSIPMVVITGQVGTAYLGKDSFQEVDISTIVSPITKASFLVSEVEDLHDILKKAFKIAASPRKGPVLVDIPKNVFTTSAVFEKSPKIEVTAKEVDHMELAKFAEIINKAKKPVIYAGGGIVSSETSGYLRDMVNKNIPVVNTLTAQGCVDYRNRWNLGHVGMHGFNRSNYAVEHCDVLISLGTRFSDRVASNDIKFASKAKILQVDINRGEIGKNKAIDYALSGDLATIMPALSSLIEQVNREEWINEIEQVEEVSNDGAWGAKPILECVRRYFNDSTIVATDVGQHQMWVSQFYGFSKPNKFITSAGLGAMGFGLGAAIGAKAGNPNDEVCLVTGDGSFRMNMNELVTVSKFKLKLLILVMNNHALGMVRQWQEIFQDKRYSQTLINDDVDLVKLAQSFNIEGRRATNLDELGMALADYQAADKAMLIDVVIPQEDNVYPMIPAGGSYNDIILK